MAIYIETQGLPTLAARIKSKNRMKILMVSQAVPFLPCHDGFRVIPANVLKELSRRHDIHLISVSDGSERPEQLSWSRRYTVASEAIPRAAAPRHVLGKVTNLFKTPFQEIRGAVSDALLSFRPDILHMEGPGLAGLAAGLPERSVPRVLSAHDCVSLRYSQFLDHSENLRQTVTHWAQRLQAMHFERRWYRHMQRVIVTSPSDADALESYVDRDNLAVIPNGIDLDHWRYRPDPQPGRIVFTGNMSWPPNEDAAEFFVKECFDKIRQFHSNAEFWIVGASPSERVRRLAEKDNVKVTGTVHDIREYVWPASVFVSPLRFGAGVKNKVLEAMALGSPVVATTQSLTGTPVEDGNHMLVANGSAEIVQSVSRLLVDRELATTLSRNARRLVERSYSWVSIASRFEDQWQSCAGIRQRSDENFAIPEALSPSVDWDVETKTVATIE